MLKLKYLVEDFELARLALTHWAHDEKTLPERLRWFRISSNAVYPFDDAEGNLCFLRLSPAEEKDEGELRGEIGFLEYLRTRGYPAMRPIPSAEGEMLLRIGAADGLWYASVFAGVPGQSLENLPMTQALATEYGATLGRLHGLSMQYDPPAERRSYTEAAAWIRATLEKLRSPQAALDALEETARQLDAMPRPRETYGLVHYDFEPDNVFWDGKGCHAIDFEDGMLHFYAIDLVQALDELAEKYHADFLRGYHTACPRARVSTDDFPLMRRFRDLYSCARLMHSLSEKPEPEPEWMPQLASRLEARRDELLKAICGE